MHHPERQHLDAALRRRRLGQVFTPRPVADWMVRWACAARPRRILDPAVGLGVFIEAVRDLVAEQGWVVPPCADVCDIDADLLQQFLSRPWQKGTGSEPSTSGAIKKSLPRGACPLLPRAVSVPRSGSCTVACRHGDFITGSFRRRYDAVIANPPYVCHRELCYGAEVMASFDRLCRRRLSRMTNLYGLFLIKIWTLLAPRGRAAVITPAEWLNADFGAAIKAYLLEENAIDAVVHFDHAANIFDGALTTAAITLLRRGRAPGEPVRLCSVADIRALRTAAVADGRAMMAADLDPHRKWTPLFAPTSHGLRAMRSSTEGNDLRFGEAPLQATLEGERRTKAGPPSQQPLLPYGRGSDEAAHSGTLGDIARCSRGIATGANDYFTLRESERRSWGIELCDLRVCITKAQHIAGDTLTDADVRRLIKEDQRIYLLSPRRPLSAAVERYLAEGRRRGIERRYLPAHRPVWYMPEQREPAPILVSVFARGAFHFVLNEAGSLNLTAYHGIYLNDPSPARVQALFAYLTSPAARCALHPHTRIYADGLLKLEPRDVEALPVPATLSGFRIGVVGMPRREEHPAR